MDLVGVELPRKEFFFERESLFFLDKRSVSSGTRHHCINLLRQLLLRTNETIKERSLMFHNVILEGKTLSLK